MKSTIKPGMAAIAIVMMSLLAATVFAKDMASGADNFYKSYK